MAVAEWWPRRVWWCNDGSRGPPSPPPPPYPLHCLCHFLLLWTHIVLEVVRKLVFSNKLQNALVQQLSNIANGTQRRGTSRSPTCLRSKVKKFMEVLLLALLQPIIFIPLPAPSRSLRNHLGMMPCTSYLLQSWPRPGTAYLDSPWPAKKV